MGVGSLYRHVKKLAAEHVGGADTAADDSGTGTVNACIRALGAAKTKLHDAVTLCCVNDSGCLGGDKALMVEDRQNSGLHELGLHDRSDDLDQRLPGEDNGAFRDGVDIAGEMKAFQVL